MVTIKKELTLKESRGQVNTDPISAAHIAIYTRGEIDTMLDGTSPTPEGIRFHFEKATDNTTVGLIAIALGVHAAGSPETGTTLHNFEMSSATRKYIRRGARNGEMTVEEYTRDFASQIEKGVSRDGITNACVFFSRNDLRAILNNSDVTQIALFPAKITRTFPVGGPEIFTAGIPETFDTLTAVGLDLSGNRIGTQIRSENPCPPHCGDDYPPPSAAVA